MEVVLHTCKYVVLILVREGSLVYYFWIQGVTIQMKATVYWAAHCCGTVYYAVQGGSNF